MQAFKCDKCGGLFVERGKQFDEFEYKDYTWPREHTKGYRVRIQVSPINTDTGKYEGIELCVPCFNQLASTPLEVLRAATQLASDTTEATKQGTPAPGGGPLDRK